MGFLQKIWSNGSGGGTPLDAAGLNDLEVRIADAVLDVLTSGDLDSLPTTYEQLVNKGQPDGYAPLGSDGKVPVIFIPAISIGHVFTAASQAAQLALSAVEGDVCRRTDESKTYVRNSGTAGTMADWTEITAAAAVTSWAGRTGDIVPAESDIPNLVNDLAALLPRSLLAAKGKLITYDSSIPGPAALLPGTNGQILSADSTKNKGITWIDPPSGSGGGFTIVERNLSGTGNSLDVAASDKMLIAHITGPSAAITLQNAPTGRVTEIWTIQNGNGWGFAPPVADWEGGVAPVSSTATGQVDGYRYTCIDGTTGQMVGLDLGRNFQ